MTCPGCKKRLRVSSRYTVKGYKKHALPGVVRVYRCRACSQSVRTLEVTDTRLNEYRTLLEERRQQHIREIAALKSKVMALTHGGNLSKIQRVRLELLKVIELTLT